MRKADVYFRERKAGYLEETKTGFRFTYRADYLSDPQARPIGLNFPLRGEPYESATFFPFFEGIIPEGWYLDIVSKTLKVDPQDRLGILLATGSHATGAVSVRPCEGEV